MTDIVHKIIVILRDGICIVAITLSFLLMPDRAASETPQVHAAHKEPRDRAQEPGPKEVDTWTEPVSGIEFVFVPGGCFSMGQTAEDKYALIKEEGREKYAKFYSDEMPPHEVCVDPFWMSRYEVNNGQYRRFRSAHNSGLHKGLSLNDDKQPVVQVSFEDAQDFTAWLSKESGRHVRLPTEAEWEYAARSGTPGIASWGDDPAQACKYANVGDSRAVRELNWKTSPGDFPCDDGAALTTAGHGVSNSFGLYDTLGNVWEWCSDWYDEDYYSANPVDTTLLDPTPNYNPSGPASGSKRVNRGGAWNSDKPSVRAANRGADAPDHRSDTIGFRLVVTVEKQQPPTDDSPVVRTAVMARNDAGVEGIDDSSIISFVYVGNDPLFAKEHGKSLCTGFMREDRYAMTAGHCLEESADIFFRKYPKDDRLKLFMRDVKVYIGDGNTKAADNVAQFELEEVVPHEYYDYHSEIREFNHADVGYVRIKMAQDKSLRDKLLSIKPIPFIAEEDLFANYKDSAYIVGHGFFTLEEDVAKYGHFDDKAIGVPSKRTRKSCEYIDEEYIVHDHKVNCEHGYDHTRRGDSGAPIIGLAKGSDGKMKASILGIHEDHGGGTFSGVYADHWFKAKTKGSKRDQLDHLYFIAMDMITDRSAEFEHLWDEIKAANNDSQLDWLLYELPLLYFTKIYDNIDVIARANGWDFDCVGSDRCSDEEYIKYRASGYISTASRSCGAFDQTGVTDDMMSRSRNMNHRNCIKFIKKNEKMLCGYLGDVVKEKSKWYLINKVHLIEEICLKSRVSTVAMNRYMDRLQPGNLFWEGKDFK